MNTPQIKYGYTTGEEFQLTGTDFVGFYNVDSEGSVYTGKYRNNTSKVLIPKSNFSADLIRSNYFKDRYPLDTLELPNKLDSILIGSGELVNFQSLNNSVTLLHDNLLYLYSKMFLGSMDIPYQYDYTAGIPLSGGNFKWYPTPNYTSFGYQKFSKNTTLSAYSEFDNIKRFVVIPFKDESAYSVIGITNTHLIALTSTTDFSSIGFTFYTNIIDNNTNEKCENLSDITFDGKFLYVADSKINGGGQVFKYDITGYYTGDLVYENKRYLIKPIGGLGGISNADRFNGATVLGSKENVVLVYDSGNDAIKVYDSNLVWKKTIKISTRADYYTDLDIKTKAKYKVLDIRYRKLNGHFYVLFNDTINSRAGLFEIDANYKLVKSYVFEDVLYTDTDVEFKRIAISEQDSNVFYLITNSTVYKKFFSKPEKTIAAFDRNKFGQSPVFLWNSESIYFNYNTKRWNSFESMPNVSFSDIDIVPNTKNYDDMFVMSSSILLHFSEYTSYNSMLRDITPDYYNLDKISFEKTENVQALVFNKEFFKMFDNLLKIKNNLKGKFYLTYNFYGDITFQQYQYFNAIENELSSLEQEYNIYINDNELVQVGVINRLFRKLYDIQEQLLKITEPVIVNFRSRISNDNIYFIA